jgi:bifunctional non-homologous end joining protein LigD
VPLQQYKAKRKFSRTPEPEGSVQAATGPLCFVVQKHRARRLHYDFRLEAGGVLKSWAIPKGPSLNPEDKRLAVLVEDHPVEYGSFEGVIPKGNYGAGTVMVWDSGVYGVLGCSTREETEKAILTGLAKGTLKIVLHGTKLKGEFALFRLSRDGENNWLMVKHRDQSATTKPVSDDDRSAKTGRTLEEIAENPDYWISNRNDKKLDLSDAPKGSMPRNIRPMLATPRADAFDDPDWLFEIKWDGFRAIAEVEPSKVRLYSRNNLSPEQRFASIVNSLKQLGHSAVLDGEAVVLDSSGKPRFQFLQNYRSTNEGTLVYQVFDLLYLDGHDLRGLPLRRRKEILAQILNLPNVRLSEHIEQHGMEFYRVAAEQGLEGIVAKDARSRYMSGRRSDCWYKIKAKRRQLAAIGGFTEQRGDRKAIGSLVLGAYKGDDFVYIGHTGTGFTGRMLADLRRTFEPLIQSTCPFKKKPKANGPVHWLRPELLCEVAFTEWTYDGFLRHPVFHGLRDGGNPLEVRVGELAEDSAAPKPISERPKKPARQGEVEIVNGPVRIDGKVAKLSNLDKIYWPDDGYAKRDLINYYLQVAEFIVPYLKDRPLSLLRHPNGIRADSFFQKDSRPQPPPDWVKTVLLQSTSKEGEKQWILCQDRATLAYVANLGCIELNPWNSRVQSPNMASYLLIDLDPVEVSFDEAVRVAQEVRRILDQIGATGFCKTSGKRGLHVYVPLGERLTHDQAKQFAELLAHVIHRRLPATTSLFRDPSKRKGRVYPDFLQNGRGKTLAVAYSVRPVPGAWVSTPLAWSEVKRGLDPSRFTIKNMARRLDKVGDLWEDVLGPGIDIGGCLEGINKLLGDNWSGKVQSTLRASANDKLC